MKLRPSGFIKLFSPLEGAGDCLGSLFRCSVVICLCSVQHRYVCKLMYSLFKFKFVISPKCYYCYNGILSITSVFTTVDLHVSAKICWKLDHDFLHTSRLPWNLLQGVSSQTLSLIVSCSRSVQQVKEYLKKEFERHGYPPNDTLHENMMEDIFAKEDKNNDGFISSREFTYKHDEL